MIYFELFYVFFYIGLLTFGGGYAMIPMIQDEMLSRSWLSFNQLSDFIAISESTPGPFAINIATFIGSQTGGVLGSICATIGVVLPSFIIIIIFSILISKITKNKLYKNAISRLSAVIISLILSTAIVFLIKYCFFNASGINLDNYLLDRSFIAMLLIMVGFLLIYKKQKKKSLNPIIIILICAILGIIFFEILKY